MGIKIDLTDKQFGNLMAIRELPDRTKKGAVKWLFKCSCGKESVHEASRVKRGQIVSCGCSRKVDNAQESLIKNMFADYKARAKIKDWKFELSFNDFKKLTQQKCSYCGIEPEERTRKFTGKANGVDRIDSSKPYEKNNVRSCCKICNIAKNNLTEEEFLNWIKRLVKNYGN